MAGVTTGEFKGFRSWVLEGDALRVELLPDLGTKMVSLVHTRTGRELLFQRDDWPVLRQPPYGAAFGDYDVSGFDEMFPTIDVCHYAGGTWAGTLLPDHGEVWPLPWETHQDGETVVAVVHGWRLPYRLEKRVRMSGASAVRIDYRATNLAGEDLHVLWAAHPLCACNESTRIVLPPGTTGVVNASPGSQRFARYAARASWPEMTTRDGQPHRLDRIGPASLGLAEKYWIDGRVTEGWGALHHTDTGEALGFAWPAAVVPYLGVWLTEGGYGGLYHVALEPATGAMDRPDYARQWGRGWVLPARGSVDWYLTLGVGQVTGVAGVTADGDILSG
jgi:hypothetical protein